MDIQLTIVIIIGLAVLFWVLRSIYRFFFVKRDGPSCGGCPNCSPMPKKETKEKKSYSNI